MPHPPPRSNDGEFGVALEGWAALSPNGTVRWKPPALYRSRCPIRVRGGPGGGGQRGFGVWGGI